jgi:hypothetical protein
MGAVRAPVLSVAPVATAVPIGDPQKTLTLALAAKFEPLTAAKVALGPLLGLTAVLGP